MTNPNNIKDMKRAVYYASKTIRTAYLKYGGEHWNEVHELIHMLDNLYAALKAEETS